MQYNYEMIMDLIKNINDTNIFKIIKNNQSSPSFKIVDLLIINKSTEKNKKIINIHPTIQNFEVMWEEKNITTISFNKEDFSQDENTMNDLIKFNFTECIRREYFNSWYFQNIFPLLDKNLTTEHLTEIINARFDDFGVLINLLYDGVTMILSAYHKDGKVLFNNTTTNNTPNKDNDFPLPYIRLMVYSVFYFIFFENKGMGVWYEPK